tara:strand:+ start:54507 stop:54680 length:174 start_codon:yes stop_codon:yes gene_type:complete
MALVLVSVGASIATASVVVAASTLPLSAVGVALLLLCEWQAARQLSARVKTSEELEL